jgi:gamma-glutamyltranspeptidase/glutathione hydrolase
MVNLNIVKCTPLAEYSLSPSRGRGGKSIPYSSTLMHHRSLVLHRSGKFVVAACALVFLSAFSTAAGAQPRPPAHAKHYMVAAAHPLAVQAGLSMLDQGGNAIDAAIATQLVLNLVEPHASGLGGGAFVLYYDAKKNVIRAYDGRETAPAAVTPDLFTKPDGKPMAFDEAVIGGRSVGVPGLARLLELSHARHGRLAWATLFRPAIGVAEKGFALSPRLHELIASEHALVRDAAAREYFYTADGKPKPAGTVIKNPEFARTLRALAASGAEAFYSGGIAHDIVTAVRNHASNPGVLTEHDLAAYRVREVAALCAPYRAYRVCGMPPSSSGGIAVLQILGILSRFDMASVRPDSTEAVHLVAEAERLAFADRNRYVADDRFAEVPTKGLIDPAYLAARSKLIDGQKSMGKAEAGVPQGIKVAYADDAVDEMAGTSHIAVVDKDGNAVSMTTTIETHFGSHVMVRGFFLNNQLTDFNFLPVEGGVRAANGVYPGKRPRSSMAPTLVFDDSDKFYMAVGSPGGPYIIGFVAKTLIAALDWKMDMQAAIDAPNFVSRNGPTEIEKGSDYEKLIGPLTALGHEVRTTAMGSGVHGIARVKDGWQGGADPRRDGIARGR